MSEKNTLRHIQWEEFNSEVVSLSDKGITDTVPVYVLSIAKHSSKRKRILYQSPWSFSTQYLTT